MGLIFSALGYIASVGMGFALGLTGGGGSILTVPILVYLFGVPATLATTYSLVIVGILAAWGAIKAYQNRELEMLRGLTFALPGVLGVFFSRKILVPLVPNQLALASFQISKDSFLLMVFSLLMLMAAVSMIRSSKNSAKTSEVNLSAQIPKHVYFLVVMGACVGVLAGFVGAGGGFLIVPALVHFGGLQIHKAVNTSLLVISLQSLLGVLGDGPRLLTLNGTWLVSILVLAFIGMTMGHKVRSMVSGPSLKRGFGYFVLTMGFFIILKEILRGV